MTEVMSPARPPAAAPTREPDPNKHILFFDGICVFCNHWVDFVIARDRAARFRFAALQTKGARDFLQSRGYEVPPALSTLVLFDGQRLRFRTDAVIGVLEGLGGLWALLGKILQVVPTTARDPIYDFISRVRYLIFGKREACRLPTPEERSRFMFGE
jgi:predicted DCC family thiol-disulfide oxidoreductase YuxK